MPTAEFYPNAPLSQFLLWCACVLVLAAISRRALGNPRCHGFYRFFAFACCSGVLIPALPYWQAELFAPHQLASWFVLFTALGMLVGAVHMLLTLGGRRDDRAAENFAFENTATLVESGIFRWVRHPMYSALLLFTWGAWLKRPELPGLAMSLGATLFLWLTAKAEERENLEFFGEAYRHYSERTKNFIPYLF
ncbi:methyltransferase family protein [Gilvimarinus sp. F26214L]|uniref:methyltransferase family protein n=1 Tax=Gilvimarinus sp. DZF01 TaxID=3461371 RepID=UPI00404551CC